MKLIRYVTAAAIGLSCIGCSSSGASSNPNSVDSQVLKLEVDDAITVFKSRDPSLSKFFDSAEGYAVFPSVGKGGLVVGGAYGEGHVFEKGARIGHTALSQGSIGLQIGGQEYREIVFFKDKATLDAFKAGSFEFAGNASAVAVRSGAATPVDYRDGVAVFTMTKGGLMLEASIGGQKFDYHAF